MSVRVFYDPDRVDQLRRKGISSSQRQLPAAASEARTGLELAEECARLRAEVDRLRQDNRRLSDEVARLTAPQRPGAQRGDERDLDDSTRRFALLELDL